MGRSIALSHSVSSYTIVICVREHLLKNQNQNIRPLRKPIQIRAKQEKKKKEISEAQAEEKNHHHQK